MPQEFNICCTVKTYCDGHEYCYYDVVFLHEVEAVLVNYPHASELKSLNGFRRNSTLGIYIKAKVDLNFMGFISMHLIT
jgi:hypothetical protein